MIYAQNIGSEQRSRYLVLIIRSAASGDENANYDNTRDVNYLRFIQIPPKRLKKARWDLHMTGVGMLVISRRGIIFGFLSHLGCSGKKAVMCSPYAAVKVALRVSRELRNIKYISNVF